MLQGLSLTELKTELMDQNARKIDWVTDTRNLKLLPNATTIDSLQGQFELTDHSTGQTAARLGWPVKHFKTMQVEHPEILSDAVNGLLQAKPGRRLMRGMRDSGGLTKTLRAVMSDRYQIFDSLDMAVVILRGLHGAEHRFDLATCNVTDSNMYIKVVFPNMLGDVKEVGDVRMGISFRTSEIGLGAATISPYIETLVCTNGMVISDRGIRQIHLGGQMEEGMIEPSSQTKSRRAAWVMGQMEDAVHQLADRDVFDLVVEGLRGATTDEVRVEPDKLLENVSKMVGLTEGESADVLFQLKVADDMTRYGLAQAITRTATDSGSYDRSDALEAIGGDIIGLSADKWRQIAA